MKETYDKHLEKLLCKICVCPNNYDNAWMWEFYSHHSEEAIKSKIKNVKKDHIAIFDLRTNKWLQVKLEDIISVEYPLFNDHIKNYKIDDPSAVWEWDVHKQKMFIDKADGIASVTPDTVAYSDIENLDDFDFLEYEYQCEKLVEELEKKPGKNPWIANFTVNRWCEINWAEMFENMYTNLPIDLAKGEVKMDKAHDAWKKLIDVKAAEAIAFLDDELSDYRTYHTAGSLFIQQFLKDPKNIEIVPEEVDDDDTGGIKIHMDDGTSTMFDLPEELIVEMEEHRCFSKIRDVVVDNPECVGIDNLEEEIYVEEFNDLLEEAEQQVEEIEVIIKMIHEQVDEYKELTSKVEDLFSLKDTWPPILLPMPFKWKEE